MEIIYCKTKTIKLNLRKKMKKVIILFKLIYFKRFKNKKIEKMNYSKKR